MNPLEIIRAKTARSGSFLKIIHCYQSECYRSAAARGIKLEEVESTLEGDLDLHGFLGLSESVRPGYEKIRVTFQVKGDGSAEELTELTKYSPVLDVVPKGSPAKCALAPEVSLELCVCQRLNPDLSG